MIKHIFLAFFLIFSSFTFADSSTCATQEYTNGTGSTYTVTKASGEICKDDTFYNAFLAFFSISDEESFENGTIGQVIGILSPLHWFLALAVAGAGVYWLLKTAEEGEVKNKMFSFLAIAIYVILLGTVSFHYIYLNFIGKAAIYSANYAERTIQSKKEISRVEDKLSKSNDAMNAHEFAKNLIVAVMSAEETKRNIERLSYFKMAEDYKSNCSLICSKKELAFTDFAIRMNSCNKFTSKYNIESSWNREHSVFDISYTKQNRQIEISHLDECQDNYYYNKENYGFSGNTGVIEFGIIDTKNSSYLTNDFIENIPRLTQIIDKASANSDSITASKYNAFKSALSSKIADIANSGKVADFSELENDSIVNSFANDINTYAKSVIDSDNDFFNEHKTVEAVIFTQAVGQRANAYLGQSRAGKNEVASLIEDAQIAVENIMKMECDLPAESIGKKIATVNGNSEVPFVSEQTQVSNNALLNLPVHCAKLGTNGFEVTSAHSEAERNIAFKNIQKAFYRIGGYYYNVQLAREKAKQLYKNSVLPKNQVNSFNSQGAAAQIQKNLSSLDATAIEAVMSADTNSRPTVKSYIPSDKNADFINYQILFGKKPSAEQLESVANEKIDISKYLDSGISTLTNNPSEITNNQIEKETSLSLDSFFEKVEQSLFSFSTYNLNRALMIDYAGNILDKLSECSVKACTNNQSGLAYAFVGSLDNAVTMATLGTSLKVIGFLGEAFADGGEQLLGSISAAPGIGLIAKAGKLLPTAIIGPVSALLGYFGTIALYVSLLYLTALIICFYLGFLVLRFMFDLFLELFLFPVINSFEAAKSAFQNNFDFARHAVLFILNVVVRGGIIGLAYVIVDLFYSSTTPFVMQYVFWTILFIKNPGGFIFNILINLIALAVIPIVLCILLLASVSFLVKLILSINSAIRIDTGPSNADLAAIAGIMKTVQLNNNEWKKIESKLSNSAKRELRKIRRG